MKKLFALLAIAAVAYGVIGALGMDVTAAPAFVLNFGRDGLTCTLSGTFNGSGHATIVANGGGQIMFSCNGTFVEPPPQRAIVTTATSLFGPCQLVVTPSGNFNASCHN